MTKVIILPLSLYMDNDQDRTEDAFKALGVGKWEMIWHFLYRPSFLEKFLGPSLSTIFDQYRKGEFTSSAFRQIIKAKFPHARLDYTNCKAAWNAMQKVNDITKQALDEAQTLIDKGFDVYWIAGTNFWHIQDAKRKLQQTQLPGIPYFSYQQGKLGRDLFTALLKAIRAKHKNIAPSDIAYFYTSAEDPFPHLGKLAWLNPFAIVKNIKYFKAKQYVASLQREAVSSNGFTPISCQPQIDKKANILSKIEQLGWIRPEPQAKTQHPAPILHQQKRQKVTQKPAPASASHSYSLRPRKHATPK